MRLVYFLFDLFVGAAERALFTDWGDDDGDAPAT